MEGSDVTFNIAGDKFQSHKLVLAARSPFFKSKFSNELEANSTEVTINDLEPKLRTSIYLNRLRLLCESHICNGVSVKSVAKILALADRYKATELKSVCLKFTAENLAAVLETDGYQQQKDECLSLQSELLKAVAGYEESSNSIAKSLSVWAQLSEGGGCGGGDTSSRHVRQRTT
ncbi:BnaC09g36870D [Brassica napus]|nr:BnaC09g36870D [Brassica napus]